jgi:hypothetical protein
MPQTHLRARSIEVELPIAHLESAARRDISKTSNGEGNKEKPKSGSSTTSQAGAGTSDLATGSSTTS